MNTELIEKVVKRDPTTSRKFCGVFAENLLPHKTGKYPCGFIANTDPKEKPGKHWVAFYLQSPAKGEFFDSYGQPPSYYNKHFVSFLNRNSFKWTYNDRDLQSAFSAVCGEFSIFYLMHRSRGISMDTIVNLFSSDIRLNDERVYRFISKYLP